MIVAQHLQRKEVYAAAAEKAAERLLHMQPDWLIVVEGVQSANDISGARLRPIELTVPSKLVYSAHVYGWSGWGQLSPYWKRSYESFAADMQHNWAYLLTQDIAPVWIGEIGVPEVPNHGDLHYWKNLIRYLKECDADFGYWAINPRKPKDNELETYALVEDDWKTLKYDYRIHDLTSLAQSPPKGSQKRGFTGRSLNVPIAKNIARELENVKISIAHWLSNWSMCPRFLTARERKRRSPVQIIL